MNQLLEGGQIKSWSDLDFEPPAIKRSIVEVGVGKFGTNGTGTNVGADLSSTRCFFQYVKRCAMIAIIAFNTAPELTLLQKVDDLCKYGFSVVHRRAPFTSVN